MFKENRYCSKHGRDSFMNHILGFRISKSHDTHVNAWKMNEPGKGETALIIFQFIS